MVPARRDRPLGDALASRRSLRRLRRARRQLVGVGEGRRDAVTADEAELEAVFAPEGPLSRAIPEYRYREQQRELALRAAQAMRDGRVLLAEAGTGTGKTVAYLVPALLVGGKVIISTGPRTLRIRRFHRTFPPVAPASGR